MLANENESGHRLSVNDDRKPQSYIDEERITHGGGCNKRCTSNLDTFIVLPGDTEAPQ
jgi:hypothetical protein